MTTAAAGRHARRLASWLYPVIAASVLAGDCIGGRAPSIPAFDPGTMASMALLLAGGLLSGLLAGLLGIGGALVTLPVMYLALPGMGIDAAHVPATAVSTGLLAMLPTTFVATWRQHSHGAIERAWVCRLALPMGLGAILGACAAATLNGPLLAAMFAAQSVYYGWRLLSAPPAADGAPPPSHRGVRWLVQLPPALVVPSVAAFCACVGMGGGSMVTPYLQHRGVAFRNAVATAAALNLCIATGGIAGFAWLANTHRVEPCLAAAALLAVGAVMAVPCGVSLAHRLSTSTLRRLVGTVNIVSALSLVGQLLR